LNRFTFRRADLPIPAKAERVAGMRIRATETCFVGLSRTTWAADPDWAMDTIWNPTTCERPRMHLL
jgi:hypothetical protein